MACVNRVTPGEQHVILLEIAGDSYMKLEVTESRTGIRSYQILTVIGSLLTIWDQIVRADKYP